MGYEDGKYEVAHCGECGGLEGELHDFGCEMEACPFCGDDLVDCVCCYDKLGIDYSDSCPDLTEEQRDRWQQILREEGRIPFIDWPQVCRYCGRLWPTMFKVPDDEWQRCIQLRHRKDMLCWHCWNWIKKMIDG